MCARPKLLTTIRRARGSSFMRALLCTLLVAFPASAKPVTGLDSIKLGADRKLRLVVRPEPRCVFGDQDAMALDMHTMAQERTNPAATELLLTIEPLVRSSFRPVVESMSLAEVEPTRSVRVAAYPRSDARRGLYLHGRKEARRGSTPAATRKSCRTTAYSTTTAWTSILRPVRTTNVPVPGPSKTRFTSFATSSCRTISSTSLPNP